MRHVKKRKENQQSLKIETSARPLSLHICKCSQSSTCLQVWWRTGNKAMLNAAVSHLADSPFVEACVTLGRHRHADSIYRV